MNWSQWYTVLFNNAGITCVKDHMYVGESIHLIISNSDPDVGPYVNKRFIDVTGTDSQMRLACLAEVIAQLDELSAHSAWCCCCCYCYCFCWSCYCCCWWWWWTRMLHLSARFQIEIDPKGVQIHYSCLIQRSALSTFPYSMHAFSRSLLCIIMP